MLKYFIGKIPIRFPKKKAIRLIKKNKNQKPLKITDFFNFLLFICFAKIVTFFLNYTKNKKKKEKIMSNNVKNK